MFTKATRSVIQFKNILSKQGPLTSTFRWLNVRSSDTPNPNVKKYETFPEMIILPEGYGQSLEVKDFAQARISPLAQLVLSIPELRSISFSPTTFSITKKPSVTWEYVDSVLDEKLKKISF